MEVDLPRDLEFINLYPISDVHRGHSLCDVESWHAYLETIRKDPIGYAIVLGDLVEAALKSSKHGDPYRTMPPHEERRVLYEELSPIRDKILALVDGNHEMRHRDTDESPIGIIAEKLDLEDRYDPVAIGLTIRFGTYEGKKNKPTTYCFYITHGSGAAKSMGAKLSRALQLRNAMDSVDGYWMGHVHGLISCVMPQPYMDPRNGKNGVRMVAYMVGGSFLLYGDYAERASHHPSAVSQPYLECHAKRKDDPCKYMKVHLPAFIRRVA